MGTCIFPRCVRPRAPGLEPRSGPASRLELIRYALRFEQVLRSPGVVDAVVVGWTLWFEGAQLSSWGGVAKRLARIPQNPEPGYKLTA
jgi:hypothetical protein